MPTLIILPNIQAADQTLTKLSEMGVADDKISVAALEEHSVKWAEKNSPSGGAGDAADTVGKTLGGVVSGGALGGVIGLLAGVAALTIPGFGPLLIAGPLAATLGFSGLAANTVTGAAVGGTIGGVSGLADALTKAGVSQDEAESIQTTLKDGGVMVAVEDGADDDLANSLSDVNYTTMVTI